ncbi:MAG: ABC transporter ATP-binding protein [Patescibacteria group bacterium]
MSKSIIEAKHITKSFHNGLRLQTVLSDVSVAVAQGEFLIVMGRSGAGKSTLLYQMGLLDHPTSGTVIIEGKDTSELESDVRTRFRLMELGYVFQDYALVPELTASENIMLPLMMKGHSRSKALSGAVAALDVVGIGAKAHNLPAQLSGGEQQRVSVARAIAGTPKIIFADEPTANLDSESSAKVIDMFIELNRKGQTIVMVTHEEEYAKHAHRVVTLRDGVIVSEVRNREVDTKRTINN